MKKMLLASTSTLHGQEYLEYLLEEIILLFKDCKKILFIPYARPSGLTHQQYNNQVKEVFKQINLNIVDYHSENEIFDNLNKCDGIFIGGGNSFECLSNLIFNVFFKNDKKSFSSSTLVNLPYIPIPIFLL